MTPPFFLRLLLHWLVSILGKRCVKPFFGWHKALLRTGKDLRKYWRITPQAKSPRRTRAKPAWVRQEVLYMKAISPCITCRKIEESFNRRFEQKRQMTVGRTYVSETLRRYHYEVDVPPYFSSTQL